MKPAHLGSQSGLCLRQPGAQRSLSGRAQGAGPGGGPMGGAREGGRCSVPGGGGVGLALAPSGCQFCFGELGVGARLSLQFGPGPPILQHSWWAGLPGLDH